MIWAESRGWPGESKQLGIETTLRCLHCQISQSVTGQCSGDREGNRFSKGGSRVRPGDITLLEVKAYMEAKALQILLQGNRRGSIA